MAPHDDADDGLIGGSGAPTARFAAIGDTVRGTVLSVERRQQTQMDTGVPLVWDDGSPKWQWVIAIQTELRDPTIADDDGERRIFAKAGLLKAIRQAVHAARHRGSIVGGELAVRYTGDDKPRVRGHRGAKLYQARYTPPAEGWDVHEPEQAAPPAADGWEEQPSSSATRPPF